MFNEANVKDRPRYYVRGRVLVFTSSCTVEFLDKDLTVSMPLYGRPDDKLRQDAGITFCVELDGFLTFEPASQVKIIELSKFVRGDYDPGRFALTYPCDPFVPIVTFANIPYPNPDGSAYTVIVTFSTLNGNGQTVELMKYSPTGQGLLISQAEFESTFRVGQPYNPPASYRPFYGA